MKILVINPGATSTKIAVFQDEEQLYKQIGRASCRERVLRLV